ncbi:MAG: hypothetical protein P1P88_26420, partial [Bacteroidales bacterium]|nr:hypothetical protein [Bacteroidales bacterium]
ARIATSSPNAFLISKVGSVRRHQCRRGARASGYNMLHLFSFTHVLYFNRHITILTEQQLNLTSDHCTPIHPHPLMDSGVHIPGCQQRGLLGTIIIVCSHKKPILSGGCQ